MSALRTLCTGLLLCIFPLAAYAQSAPATAPTPGPFAITAKADPAAVHPGDSIKFDVTIKNVSADPQTIDVPNIVWAAATDTPQVLIPGWPARGGIGPVVVFKATQLAPGESYQHTWSAYIVPAAAKGDLVLRVGVPLKRGGEKTWSKPLTLHIAAPDAPKNAPKDAARDAVKEPIPVGVVNNANIAGATAIAAPAPKDAPKDAVANPLYTAWKGQEGKRVEYTRTTQISGGAPMPGGGAVPTSTPLIISLDKLTVESAVVSMDFARNALPDSLTIPATFAPNDPACPKAAGKEDLTINGKTYACTKYTYTTRSKEEISRDSQGLPASVTVWLAEGIPGGLVQRKITLTIRASYEITDRLGIGPQ